MQWSICVFINTLCHIVEHNVKFFGHFTKMKGYSPIVKFLYTFWFKTFWKLYILNNYNTDKKASWFTCFKNMYNTGADPGFQVRGGALKKSHRAEGGGKIFGVFTIFLKKKSYFFPILGGGTPPPLDPPL